MDIPNNFIKILHSGIEAITYVDVDRISHVVDLRNSVRIHLSNSGDYITSTEAIETILDKIQKTKKACTSDKDCKKSKK